ncbi:hypothetical protein FSP39_006441 [Pinctada imbricata]|uniref:pseudouridine 5'-phosphatase n=1 Tax=Pinctada imbricata TaxID=66713 RepID=A0AA88YE15_PINIB|nr:hypothetical protein FSP39_006441 [Pinctada imbricata]
MESLCGFLLIILDTEKVYVDITTKIAAEFGKTYSWEIEFKIMGKKETEAAKAIIDALELPITVDEFLERSHAEQNRLFPLVPLMPGADKLVRHLHKCNVPIAVATGSNTQSFALKSSGHKEFFSLFHHTVLSGDDPEVEHGKPAPDCFLLAAKRFKDSPDPAKVLVFEDAPNGVDAAHAAGMQCVWVPHDEQDHNTHKHKCTQILDNLENFIPESFGLPAYTS